MEYFAEKSNIPKEKWDYVISVFRKLKEERIDISNFLPDESWNSISVGYYLEELRQLRGAGKLTRLEVNTLNDLKIKMHYRKYRWRFMYEKAKAYYTQYGHLSVKTTEDLQLSKWINDQRRRYQGGPRKRPNRNAIINPLEEEQKHLLEEIDIAWDVSTFNKYYPHLLEYYKIKGDTNVPKPCWINGVELWHWVNHIQFGNSKISEEQKELLKQIGFVFKTKKNRERYVGGTSFPEQVVFFYFRKIFDDAEPRVKIEGFELDMYSEKNKIAIEYDGFMWHKRKGKLHMDNEKDELCNRMGIKLIRLREEGLPKTNFAINYYVPTSYELLNQPLHEIFKEELGNPDISIDIKRDCMEIQDNYLNLESIAINRHIKELIEYKEKHGFFPPPSFPKNSGLYGFVNTLRQLKKGKGGRLTDKQIAELDSIGMIWDKFEYIWEVGYMHACEYYNMHKQTLDIPHNYISPDGYRLGNWIVNQRHRKSPNKRYRGKLLTDEQIRRLNEIGMSW